MLFANTADIPIMKVIATDTIIRFIVLHLLINKLITIQNYYLRGRIKLKNRQTGNLRRQQLEYFPA